MLEHVVKTTDSSRGFCELWALTQKLKSWPIDWNMCVKLNEVNISLIQLCSVNNKQYNSLAYYEIWLRTELAAPHEIQEWKVLSIQFMLL